MGPVSSARTTGRGNVSGAVISGRGESSRGSAPASHESGPLQLQWDVTEQPAAASVCGSRSVAPDASSFGFVAQQERATSCFTTFGSPPQQEVSSRFEQQQRPASLRAIEQWQPGFESSEPEVFVADAADPAGADGTSASLPGITRCDAVVPRIVKRRTT